VAVIWTWGPLEEALASEIVALVDVVTDADLITPTSRLSEITGDRLRRRQKTGDERHCQ
jgi:hypothetical protein